MLPFGKRVIANALSTQHSAPQNFSSERLTVYSEVKFSCGLLPANAPAVTDNRWGEADFSLLIDVESSDVHHSRLSSRLICRRDKDEWSTLPLRHWTSPKV
jgi:hypothetical protein